MFINGHEQSAVGVYWVSDGVDQCLVGFLHHHQVKHRNKLEGDLCQVTEVYSDNSESLQSATSTRRTLVVQLQPLCQVMNPTKLGKQRTNCKALPKLLQMWKHLQTPIQNHQSKRDPLEVQQKRADVQRIGN